MEKNLELLERVGDHIGQLLPRQVNMTIFYSANPCGTVACIAGWGLILSGTMTEEGLAKTASLVIFNKACAVFGLSQSEGDRLFFLANWPSIFRDRYFNASDEMRNLKPQVVKDRINHFIETGE